MDRAGALRLARNPSFRALWLGQLISIFGDRFHYLALLALIIQKARDPLNPAPELAIVPLVSFLPAILFGPMAGALVDSWNTRRVLLVSDAARGVLALALIPAAGWGGAPAAFALVFALYLANIFFLPARSAIVPLLVPGELLTAANSLATLAGVLATLAGSLLGGFVVERVGWRWGFAIDAATYFASVAALARIRLPGPGRAAGASSWRKVYGGLTRSVVDGARVAARERAVLGSLAALALLWVAGGALHVAGTLLVKQRMAGVVEGVGALLTTTGIGMVAGTLLMTGGGRRALGGGLTAGTLLGMAAALMLFAAGRGVLALHAAALIAGFFVACLLVLTEGAIQRAVSAEARGRVFALRDFVTRLGVLASAGATGWLVSARGVRPETVVFSAGVILAVGSAAGWILGARGQRARFEADP
jgi:MFS family permease